MHWPSYCVLPARCPMYTAWHTHGAGFYLLHSSTPLPCHVKRKAQKPHLSPNHPFSTSFSRNRWLVRNAIVGTNSWVNKVIAVALCPWEPRLRNWKLRKKRLKIWGQCKLFSSQSLLKASVAGAGSAEQMWHCFAGMLLSTRRDFFSLEKEDDWLVSCWRSF